MQNSRKYRKIMRWVHFISGLLLFTLAGAFFSLSAIQDEPRWGPIFLIPMNIVIGLQRFYKAGCWPS